MFVQCCCSQMRFLQLSWMKWYIRLSPLRDQYLPPHPCHCQRPSFDDNYHQTSVILGCGEGWVTFQPFVLEPAATRRCEFWFVVFGIYFINSSLLISTWPFGTNTIFDLSKRLSIWGSIWTTTPHHTAPLVPRTMYGPPHTPQAWLLLMWVNYMDSAVPLWKEKGLLLLMIKMVVVMMMRTCPWSWFAPIQSHSRLQRHYVML